jgi:hypothetical protein
MFEARPLRVKGHQRAQCCLEAQASLGVVRQVRNVWA